MRQLSIISLFILILSMANFGCKNKDCHKDGTCAPDYRWMPLGEAKSYLYSLPGSYWIYQNIATGDLDTQTCTNFICDTIVKKGDQDFSKHITIEYERIRKTIESTFNQCVNLDETNGYNPNAPRPLQAIVTRRVSNQIGNNILFLYPFIKDGESSNSKFINLDSTITLHGKTYSNVAQIEIAIDDIWEEKLNCIRPNSIYYWAKDIGLVKKEMKSCNYSWELIEYNIIK